DGSLTSSSTASLTLAAVNDAPVITAASLTVSEGGTVLISPANIGVADPDSSSFAFTVTNVTHGTFQTTADGVTWVNATTFTSPDLTANHVRFVHDGGVAAPTFSIQADDGAAINNLSNILVGSVLFNNVNHAPVATPVTLAAGTEDVTYTITAATLLAGVTDVDGPSLSITSVSVASGGGSIVNNGNGTWTYTPAANYNGPVSFSYTASDGSLSANSTASLTIGAVNNPPVATPVTLAVGTEDTAYTINASALLAGVTDVDGPSLSITAVSVASGGGSVVNNGNGTWSYTPAANYNGPVSFNYTASDGSLTSSSTASLTLAAVHDAPAATPVTLAAPSVPMIMRHLSPKSLASGRRKRSHGYAE
ncbi:MAG TPA: cadherin-like domain-containing protein, partial [Xanthobacteraceae bacterium]|nr:cadherin-like domain-containing protein [Xanthobacteraceae bacterium]